MKRIIPICLISIMIILLLVWCDYREPYTLSQPVDAINAIEIVYVANDNILVGGFHDSIETVCVINEDQWDAFLAAFYEIPSKNYYPSESVTGNVIRITYEDGSFELIGQASVFYCSADRDWDYLPYAFDFDAYHIFVWEYC